MSKEKSKSHPFAQHLRETEDVLWMAPRANTISWQQALRMGVILDIGLAFLVIFAIVIKGYFNGYDALAVIAIAFATIFLCAPVAFVIVFIILRAQQHTKQIYAVTTERLLYRIEQDVKTIELKNVPAISIFKADSTKGSLTFGIEFPMWPDVKNPATVKQIIEDARAGRPPSIRA